MHGKTNDSVSIPITLRSSGRYRSATIYLPSNTISRSYSISSTSPNNNESAQSTLPSIHTSLMKPQSDDSGLEMIDLRESRKNSVDNAVFCGSTHYSPSIIEHYGVNDTQEQSSNCHPSMLPRLPPRLPHSEEEFNSSQKRTFPISIFLLEICALVVVFILCMVLVLAIREEQVNLRTTMQFVYSYIYLISIIWMIWCTSDILKFRRQFVRLTSTADDHSEYMDIVEQNPQNISYFPDIHNTGGLFMRIGAGILCMGSLLLTVIELAETIEIIRTSSEQHNAQHTPNYPRIVFLAESITYIFRFLFHCVQFIFLFRYGNIIIDRYHSLAKLGLIHLLIANFCTWFEAIVTETLEQLHKQSKSGQQINTPMTSSTTAKPVEPSTTIRVSVHMLNFLKTATSEKSSSNQSDNSALEFIDKIQTTLDIYLYPCLIEYSLISITVFYIMWLNIGKTENRAFAHFRDRHIFIINCSRASGGLLIGGIMLLLTIVTLILDYIFDPSIALSIIHITELILLVVSLSIVCLAYVYTTKLSYDQQAHVNIFDQILIVLTTVGDFAYSLFGLFASIFIEKYTIDIPRFIEILIGILALSETFLQSAFILDTLKRRTRTKADIRKKPGRELITALLLINLAIWMHDSLSGKKVKFSPLQVEYYDPGTWAIIQAFTSPLSIFYRFHSSVCLADIWQEVYRDDDRSYSRGKPTA